MPAVGVFVQDAVRTARAVILAAFLRLFKMAKGAPVFRMGTRG